MRGDVMAAIALMGVASYACRVGGYFMMRYVAITPRVEAWLNAIPISLMGAILGPAASRGGPAEWLGLIVTIGMMRATGRDFVSVFAGVTAVALARAAMN